MFRYWFVFSLIFFFKSAFAVDVADLYTAKVNLSSQTLKDQSSALKKAFEAVLIKISGDDRVLTHAFIKNETLKYKKYLIKFNYVTNENENKLVASFDEIKINQLFFQQKIPLWGSLRPLVLFWVVIEDGFYRRILSETIESPLHDEITAIAKQRGLPIVLPLMDLTDTQNIEISDLWGRFIDPIKKASQRYFPENIVIIRISKQVNSTSKDPECELPCQQNPILIDWHFVATQGNKVEMGKRYEGSNEIFLIKNVMSDITSNIAKKYALTTEVDHELVIDVANIDSLSKYVEVSQFLEKLSAISSVKLIKAQGNNRRFQLSLMGSTETILASLKLNKKLKQFIDPLIGQNLGAVPVFYWEAE